MGNIKTVEQAEFCFLCISDSESPGFLCATHRGLVSNWKRPSTVRASTPGTANSLDSCLHPYLWQTSLINPRPLSSWVGCRLIFFPSTPHSRQPPSISQSAPDVKCISHLYLVQTPHLAEGKLKVTQWVSGWSRRRAQERLFFPTWML